MPKILYVEDNLLNITLVRRMLQPLDFSMVEVCSGLIATGIALHERPDVILLDVHLPDMSGLEVVSELKSHPELAAIPVIALTADPFIYPACKIAGCDGFLTKPISRAVLVRTLLQFLPHARNELQ